MAVPLHFLTHRVQHRPAPYATSADLQSRLPVPPGSRPGFDVIEATPESGNRGSKEENHRHLLCKKGKKTARIVISSPADFRRASDNHMVLSGRHRPDHLATSRTNGTFEIIARCGRRQPSALQSRGKTRETADCVRDGRGHRPEACGDIRRTRRRRRPACSRRCCSSPTSTTRASATVSSAAPTGGSSPRWCAARTIRPPRAFDPSSARAGCASSPVAPGCGTSARLLPGPGARVASPPRTRGASSCASTATSSPAPATAMRLLETVVPRQRWGVREVAPPGWRLYFKGGWGSGTGAVDHQVALLERGRTRVAIAVLTTAQGTHAYDKETLRGVFERLVRRLGAADDERGSAGGNGPPVLRATTAPTRCWPRRVERPAPPAGSAPGELTDYRWPIEVCYEDAKHIFGVGDARNRAPKQSSAPSPSRSSA